MIEQPQIHDEEILPWECFWLKPHWDLLTHCHQQNKLSHAYILQGGEGVGVFDFVEKMAQYLHCETPVDNKPCLKCHHCLQIVHGNFADLKIIEILEKKKEIGVEQIRRLSQFFQQTGHSQGYRIVLIKRAEQMTINAANALLKTLEEPGNNSLLFLTSEQPQKLMATVRSRCHMINLTQIDPNEFIIWAKSNGLSDFNDNEWANLMSTANGEPLELLKLLKSDRLHSKLEARQLFHQYLNKKISLDDYLNAVQEFDIDIIWQWIGIEISSLQNFIDFGADKTVKILQVYEKMKTEMLTPNHVDKWLLLREFLIKIVAN